VSEENDEYSSTVQINIPLLSSCQFSQKSKVATTDCIYFEVTNRDKPTNTLDEGVSLPRRPTSMRQKVLAVTNNDYITVLADSTAAISIHAAREKLK
jgi:large exoprotein involved in heme utilization and adhesion